MRAELAIRLYRAGDGTVAARGDLARTPFWCRWTGDVLWFVGSAATPVGDDDITIDLHVGEGVDATVRSVAAMVVYAARGEGTTLTTRLHVAVGASLVWQPEPVIVTARARHRSFLVADVDAGGTLVVDDLVVLGRSDEEAGAFRSTTEVRREGIPLSLTSFDTATPGWSGPGGTAGAKVIGTRLLVEPAAPHDARAEPPVDPPADAATVVLRPEAGGALATTLAADPDAARARLDTVLPIPSSSATPPEVVPVLNAGRAVEGPDPVQNDRAPSIARF